jgi:hypothetical protein
MSAGYVMSILIANAMLAVADYVIAITRSNDRIEVAVWTARTRHISRFFGCFLSGTQPITWR